MCVSLLFIIVYIQKHPLGTCFLISLCGADDARILFLPLFKNSYNLPHLFVYIYHS